jgi:subtilisin-like proprotein convertase family protein
MPRVARLVAITVAIALVPILPSGGPVAAGTTAEYADTAPNTIGSSYATPFGGITTINDGTQTVPAPASPYPSVASLDGAAGTITDVDVVVTFGHASPADVDMMLVGPQGQRSVLMSDVGGVNLVDVGLRFDDAAELNVPLASLPGGKYRPTDNDGVGVDSYPLPAPPDSSPAPLAVFNGLKPNGDWKLYVVDDNAGYTGSLNWYLEVRTTGSRYPATIDVSGAAAAITDVDVVLDGLSHARPADVDLLLVGPQGQQATVLSDAGGGNAVTGVHLVLDDEADASVGPSLGSGRYQPTNGGDLLDAFRPPAPIALGPSALSVFDGSDPNGTWSLYVMDDEGGGHGAMSGWSLRITTDGAAPTPTGSPTTPVPTPTASGVRGDTTSPRVASTRPETSATAVRRGADVTATLTEAVRPGTVTRATAYLVRKGTSKHLPATVTYRPGTRQVVIDPARRLRAHTTYRAVITTAVKDRAGNRLDQNPTKAGLQPKTWRFTTR